MIEAAASPASPASQSGAHGGLGASSPDLASTSGHGEAADAAPGGGRARRRKPGAKWDGRVSSLSLAEYREMKWSMDAAYNSVLRRGPSYTCRPQLQRRTQSATNVMLTPDVCKALDATRPSGPCWSMSVQLLNSMHDASPGPAQYMVPSTMNPNKHPTIPKNTGPKFGTEVLQANDEDAPAPGQYTVDNYEASARIKRSPSYSCQGREAWREPTRAPGPGVGEYEYPFVTRTGKITPSRYTMQGKTEPLEKPRGERRYILPGPGHYPVPGAGAKNDNVARHRSPMWRFGRELRGLG